MAHTRWKLVLAGLLVLSVAGILYLGYFCRGPNCALKKGNLNTFKSNYEAYFHGRFIKNHFSEEEVDKEYDLDLEDQDVIVFLHIQKTGGTTFGKHLVQDLDVQPPCDCYRRQNGKKRCDCYTHNKQVWLFSRFSTGWRCGLHADWTELKNCVDDWFQEEQGKKHRRYFYITILRDPVYRFLSEWIHVSKRGGTWKTTALRCNGREATLQEVPFCYHKEDWRDVTLEEFMACKHNLAINRQTRMLANLSKVNCYNTTGMSPEERNRIMLESAKENLKELAYFGLTEFQNYSQFLFEHTLHINFLTQFVQNNNTHSSRDVSSAEVMRKIAELNHLDIELYQFAKDLFFQRVVEAYIEEDLPVPQEVQQHVEKALSASELTQDDSVGNQETGRTGDENSNQLSDDETVQDSDETDDDTRPGPDTKLDQVAEEQETQKRLRNYRVSDRQDTELSELSEEAAAEKLRQSGLVKSLKSDDAGNPPLIDSNTEQRNSHPRRRAWS